MTVSVMVSATPPDRMKTPGSRVASVALAYAALGWRVYPVERGGKRPLYQGWLADATTDPVRIRRWWRSDAGAPNVGVVAGERFDVLDIEADYVAAFCDAARTRGLLPTPTARSGRGGLHVYVAPLGLGTRHLLLGGIHIGELKGSGGVVVPPSVTDRPYSWLRPPSDTPVAKAPDWVRGLVRAPAPAAFRRSGRLSPSRAVALVAGLYRVVAEAAEGERNGLLFWAACRVADHGVDRAAATDILLSAALRAGLPEREARATIASGLAR